jgi:hypothetical protein
MIEIVIKYPGEKPQLMKINGDLESMQRLVGGYVECVNFDGKILDMWCNEEGKLMGLDYNFNWNGDPIVGTVFFCTADSEGDSISITKEQIGYLTEIFGTSIE